MASPKTDEQIKKLLKAYALGYHHSEAAKFCNVSYATAFVFYHKYKEFYNWPAQVSENLKTTLHENIEEAIQLSLEGWSLEKLGRKYGNITRERVRQIFAEYNFHSKNSGKARRKHFYCKNGHKLNVGEYTYNCPICKSINKEKEQKACI